MVAGRAANKEAVEIEVVGVASVPVVAREQTITQTPAVTWCPGRLDAPPSNKAKQTGSAGMPG